ncbi:hypothetical protein Tco_0762705 [Tanacetum coccineum]
MVESSKPKTLKKFDYVNIQGETFFMTEEQIDEQKKIEQIFKDEIAKKEVEMRKEELIDLRGFELVEKLYKAKMKDDGSDETIQNFKASDFGCVCFSQKCLTASDVPMSQTRSEL